jgi:hypothetical protein
MSLSPPEKQILNDRVDDMLELIVAHRKLVEKFLVPIAEAAIARANKVRIAMHDLSTTVHPRIDRTQDAGLALADEESGEAMLARFEDQLTKLERVQQNLDLANHDFLSSPNATEITDRIQTGLVKSCQDYALDLISEHGTPDRDKAYDLEDKEYIST